MKGKIDKEEKIKKKYQEEFKNILPEEFNTLDIIANGKKILANMASLMEIVNVESPAEIISSMNKASTNFFYFGRIKNSLQAQLIGMEEDFDIWFASKAGQFLDESSEKAKEKRAMEKYSDAYKQKKDEISKIRNYLSDADIAMKSLEKNIGLIQSIGAMIRAEIGNSKNNNMGFKDPEGEDVL